MRLPPRALEKSRESLPFLNIRGLGRTFGRMAVLRDVSFSISRGETVALFGANGAGKTTLLRIASTLLSPTRGTIDVDGQPLRHGTRSAYRRRIGVVGHATFLYEDFTALENLMLHAHLHGVPAPAARVEALLRQVGLWERRNQRVGAFSRGMQQKVSLARALVSTPELLLLDEPFSGLDGEGAAILMAVLEERSGSGGATLFSSHDIPRGLALSHRFLILAGGGVGRTGESASFRDLPPHEQNLARLAAAPA